jgi:tetratricopeptide (TPR) repeat protein
MVDSESPGVGENAVRQAPPARTRRWRLWLCTAIVVAVAGAVTVWFWPRDEPPAMRQPNPDVDIAEWEPPVAAAPGYLGPQACAPCHGNRVAEFQRTRHFRACVAPQAVPMPTGFTPGKGLYATRDPALKFEMLHIGDEFVQRSVQETPKGKRQTDAPIGLIYGAAGSLDEVYFTWHDDGLYELPVVWLHPQNRWAMVTYNPYGVGGDFAREARPRCIECHTTWMDYVAGSGNRFRRDHAILGVTCENCHGPGRDHVAFHQAHPEADTARAIIDPRELVRERQLEICTQCHSNAIVHRRAPFQYRPGAPLNDYYRTLRTEFPENDHVANQVQYLRQSKCFQMSATLTCTSCHSPHRPSDPANPGAANRACGKCHQPADCNDQKHLPAPVRGDCVGCHMPPRVWMNVHFHTEDDQYVPPIRRTQHRIAVDPVARREVLLAWLQSQNDDASKREAAGHRAALLEYWLNEADARTQQHRLLAAIGALREALRIDPAAATRERLRQAVARQAQADADLAAGMRAVEERHFEQAIEILGKVLTLRPNLAVAHGKLGTAYAASGKPVLARKHLQAVAEYDPDDAYGWMMLGWWAYLEERQQDAVDAYQRAAAIDPSLVKLHYQWALALMKLNRMTEAAEQFQQTLAIDPNHAGACQGMSHVLRQQKLFVAAVGYAKRAARLTEYANADVLLSLAEAYAAADRFALARDTGSKAMLAAQTGNPGQASSIRWRVEQWRVEALKKSE